MDSKDTEKESKCVHECEKISCIEEFFTCPNCKRPVFRKEALMMGLPINGKYCGYCGTDLSSAVEITLERIHASKALQ